MLTEYGGHRTGFKPNGDDISDGETSAVAADYGFAVGNDGQVATMIQAQVQPHSRFAEGKVAPGE